MVKLTGEGANQCSLSAAGRIVTVIINEAITWSNKVTRDLLKSEVAENAQCSRR